jgi:hypothetical protein
MALPRRHDRRRDWVAPQPRRRNSAFKHAKHTGALPGRLVRAGDNRRRPHAAKQADRESRMAIFGTMPNWISRPRPVRLYWSATVYDRATHSFIREMPKLACSSLTPGLIKNADGSMDIYFGPGAPAGKEANWVPTKSGSEFEVLFRFYGPEKPLFDKTWKLGDIEEVK